MHYLWMELDARASFVVGDRSTGSIIRMRQHLKPTSKVHESPWLIHMVVPSSTLKQVRGIINQQ